MKPKWKGHASNNTQINLQKITLQLSLLVAFLFLVRKKEEKMIWSIFCSASIIFP